MSKVIIIKESAEKRIFMEAISMERKRGEEARKFRSALKRALRDETYEYNPETNEIKFDGYTYEIGKSYFETEDGNPVQLHCTQKTIERYLNGN